MSFSGLVWEQSAICKMHVATAAGTLVIRLRNASSSMSCQVSRGLRPLCREAHSHVAVHQTAPRLWHAKLVWQTCSRRSAGVPFKVRFFENPMPASANTLSNLIHQQEQRMHTYLLLITGPDERQSTYGTYRWLCGF